MLVAASRYGWKTSARFAAPIRSLTLSTYRLTLNSSSSMSTSQPVENTRTPEGGVQRRRRPRPNRGRGGPSLVQTSAQSAPPPMLGTDMSGIGRAQAFSTTSTLSAAYQSKRRFADTKLSPELKSKIPWEYMSEIQAQTVDVALDGQDLLGQAKTGTGKTVAFLLPIVNRLLQKPSAPGAVGALILSPTRELAMQIAKECVPLIKGTSLNVRTLVGGTNINTDLKGLAAGCDIIVGTPGRVKDHLQNMQLAPRLATLTSFVLDEADRLLDMGFAPEIRQIISHLPDRKVVPRQTMLFSATMPRSVMDIKSMALLPGHAHVSTLDPNEANAHMHVKQHYIVAPLTQHYGLLTELIARDVARHGSKSKVMAFYPTARGAELASDLLRGLDHKAAFGRQVTVFEQHSRLSMNARVKSTNGFRDVEGGVMATSDVSGRGMDFPNVTLVLQMGPPAAGDDYVHRLGRTARAGTDGYGVIVFAPFDVGFMNVKGMKEMPLAIHPNADEVIASALTKRDIVDASMKFIVTEETKGKAYAALLGLYATGNRFSKLSSLQAVEMANDYAFNALHWTGSRPPPIKKQAAGKMGLSKTPGLNLVHALPNEQGRHKPQAGA